MLSNYKKPDNLKLNIVDKGVNKKSNRSQHDELVEKLKAQIRIFKSTILKYKEKIKKLRQENSSLKNSNRLLRNAIKNDDFDNIIIEKVSYEGKRVYKVTFQTKIGEYVKSEVWYVDKGGRIVGNE